MGHKYLTLIFVQSIQDRTDLYRQFQPQLNLVGVPACRHTHSNNRKTSWVIFCVTLFKLWLL